MMYGYITLYLTAENNGYTDKDVLKRVSCNTAISLT